MTQAELDAALERQIDAAREAFATARHTDELRRGWANLAGLIAQRSTAQIARMESERGLG